MIIIIIIITISIVIIVIIIMIYIYNITDMCCCQLASAVARLPPVLASSCLCFVAPKQGPDSGPKNEATILKLIAQLPNLWPQFWARFAFCKECVGLRQVASSIHVFLRLVPGCWFHMQDTQWRKAKSMQAHSPKNGSASQRKPKRNVSKGAGMPVLFCSKHDCHKQCKDMRTASGSVQNPAAQPPAPPNIKVGLITSALCRKQLHHARQQDWLLWVATLIPGERGHVCARAHPHTSRRIKYSHWLGRKTTQKLLSTVSHFILAWPQSY